MGSTTAAPYQDKLLLTGTCDHALTRARPTLTTGAIADTGLYTDEVVVCTIPPVAKA